MVLGKLILGEKSEVKQAGRGAYLWWCKCFCGKDFLTRKRDFLKGNAKSCGCAKMAIIKAAITTHGHSRRSTPSRTYHSWKSMISRCGNEKNRVYKYYGARGISVCSEWRVFANFLADMGEAPDGKSLDRIDANLNYSKTNCRWATASEQNSNRRNSVGKIIDGKWTSLTDLASQCGVSREKLYDRGRKAGDLVYKYEQSKVAQ